MARPSRSQIRRRLQRPPSHWTLFALILLALCTALVVEGYTTHEFGRSGTQPKGSGSKPAGLSDSGSVLDLSGPAVRAASPPRGVVALTFDDGPDPRWTPQVLAVLRAHHVPATFFLVGSRVLADPGLVRQELRDGNEVGNHTFVHTELGAVAPWRASLEINLTQTALAGAAGVHTGLLRLPYSSVPSALTEADFAAAKSAAHRGYLVVLANQDGEDWKRPGVDTILANALPAGGQGAVIMLHDGGGDRSQTVAAADRLITLLQARGYRFATVTGAVGLPPHSGTAPVQFGTRLQGLLLLYSVRIGKSVTSLLELAVLFIGILSVIRAALLVGFAHRHRRDAGRRRDDPDFHPPVSVVVPAYNEEAGIRAAVESFARSLYPEVEVIVVDDGSSDRTAELAAGTGDPNVVVLTQANTGKPGALNAGIARASHDLIVTVDGDTVFQPDTIRNLVQPFADPKVGAVSGNTKVGNRKGMLGRWQHIEYVMGFNLDRRMYDVLDCMPTVPGAVGAFRRKALEEVAGFSDDTLAEDTDITMAVNRAGWRVVYEERAVAWTEAPASLGDLWRQRYRWSYGTFQAMWKHRGAVRQRDQRHLGRRGLPYLALFQVLLPALAPVVDLFGVWGLLFLPRVPVLTFWLGFNLLAFGLALLAFRLDREPLDPLWSLPLQQFVYRQLMYLVVLQSLVTAVVGSRLRWHKPARSGSAELSRPQGAQSSVAEAASPPASPVAAG
jgi:cellulose synthase/poly-beta-1,6-N-acetylglucosamine synthase-like glycosyltransferase/peptidoglycan/xylan/chitin deacetylase (PgdA/CDA1 family)